MRINSRNTGKYIKCRKFALLRSTEGQQSSQTYNIFSADMHIVVVCCENEIVDVNALAKEICETVTNL